MDKQGAVQLWSTAAKVLKNDNPIAFENWFKTLEPIDFDGKKLILQTENLFSRNILLRNHIGQIESLLTTLCGTDIVCELVLPGEAVTVVPEPAAEPVKPAQSSKYQQTVSYHLL